MVLGPARWPPPTAPDYNRPVHVRSRTVVDAGVTAVHGAVRDLATYPSWLGIVHRASLAEGPDGGTAWSVDVGARLGPARLVKRLRMVRVADEPERLVRFERREMDGKPHPPWLLEVVMATAGAGATELTVDLHYGGRRWLPGLDRLVRDDARRAGPRLATILTTQP